ncbi:MAG: MBL fold metallo-hydrolase [Planctomycetota bacterium]|jgi:glyoxylase-like metal-dependent hydrolase (beta-lactamase superfamily II)
MKRARRCLLGIATAAVFAAIATSASVAQDAEGTEIETIAVSKNVYMLVGRGGNIGLSIGDDGAFMIDDQFAPLTEQILAAVATLTDEPVRFVVNTHWHFDHTGGNLNFGKAGAIIVAHENVRKRMSTEQFMEAFGRTFAASPEPALPVVTFPNAVTFHFNDDEIKVFHVSDAHTDGDAIIHFVKANVVHMGDTYFNGMYPFIDISTGGSIDGVIEAADRVLAFVDSKTKIIPGHGALSGVSELREYRQMLVKMRDRIGEMIAEGKSRAEVIAAKPTRRLDAKWGGGFMQPDPWVGIVYDGLVKR